MIPADDDTDSQPAQASAWNIANALTILRIALVPVFGWFLLHDDGQLTSYRLLAAAVFVVATATDRMDGDIARARGLVTDFGKVSDPIADKALMGMALVGLSIIDLLPWWVTVLVLVREVGITILRFMVIRHGVIPASRGGKLKTALQAVAILLYILPLSSPWHLVAVVVMTLAVIVTVVTGVDYVLRAHILRTTSPRAQAKRERRAAAAVHRANREASPAEVAPDQVSPGQMAPGQVAPGEVAPDEVLARKGLAGDVLAGEVPAREGAPEVAAGESAARRVARPEV